MTERKRRYVWLALSVDGESLGRMIIQLQDDKVPYAAENFRLLCTGEKGFGYKGSKIFEAHKSSHCLAGDIVNNDGTGNKTIEGEYMGVEDTDATHEDTFTVSLKRWEHRIGSQFIITFRPMAHDLDADYMVIGKICKGVQSFIRMMHKVATNSGEPSATVTIEDCGEFPTGYSPVPTLQTSSSLRDR